MARLNIRFLNVESAEEAVKIFHGEGTDCFCPKPPRATAVEGCRAAKTWRLVNEEGTCYMCGSDSPHHVAFLKSDYLCVV